MNPGKFQALLVKHNAVSPEETRQHQTVKNKLKSNYNQVVYAINGIKSRSIDFFNSSV